MVATHALFAMKVQHKLRNRVAGSFAAGSFLIGGIGAKFANLSDAAGSAKRPRGDAGRDRPAGHRRRRSSNANGLCWRILADQQELSRDLKYMARARIPEFESDMPSHAVGLSQVRDARRFGGAIRRWL
jgi:hypothetical protein